MKLIAKLSLADYMSNKYILQVLADVGEGTVDYRLMGENSRQLYSITNLQCGWRGPALPDNTYEYESSKALLDAVVEAVRGGTKKVMGSKLFV